MFRFPFIRPGGQAVKTPPFHGGNTGSIPVRVTMAMIEIAPINACLQMWVRVFFLYSQKVSDCSG